MARSPMMTFCAPLPEIIKRRRSCRTFEKKSIAAVTAAQLHAVAGSLQHGPFQTSLRFELVADGDKEARALKGLGTYGFIKNPAGFLIGAVGPGEKNLEDFGFAMEALILYATSLGLGSCWLGGSFNKSRFAARVRAAAAEIVPAVAAVGYPAEETRLRALMRIQIKADVRKPWHTLFFRNDMETPLAEESAGAYAGPLHMLRLAPSASNKQPWRVVQQNACFHFYLLRSSGDQRHRSPLLSFTTADLQRVDMGIAMCHFQLTSEEMGLKGEWRVADPGLAKPNELVEYIASWVKE
ncbi:nitroreductase [bacterium]|nr:nitroreductase [bacterium]